MATWADIIGQSLLEIGVKVAGEPLTDGEQESGMTRARQMLDSWRLEGLLSPGHRRYEQVLVSAGSRWTLAATGGDIDLPPPPTMDIVAVCANERRRALVRVGEPELLRAAHNGPASRYFYEPGSGLLKLDGIAPAGATLELTFPADFSVPSDAQDAFELPQGYERAVVLALAVELAAQYGVRGNEIAQTTLVLATQAKQALLNANRPVFSPPLEPVFGREKDGMLYGRRGYLH